MSDYHQTEDQRQIPATLCWSATFFGVLTAPKATFAHLSRQNEETLSGFPGALATVILVFGLDGLRMSSPHHLKWALINIPSSIVAGLVFWLSLTSVLALAAACFNVPKARIRASVVAFGWSFLPWLFMAPVSCYAGLLGPSHVLLSALPFIWVFVLQLIAINESYQLKSWQTLSLVFVVPVILCVVQIMQLTQALYATLGSLI